MNGLQYRTAAIAGITTQFAWGAMEILAFYAFYQTGGDFPMDFQALSSYVWLQQAFLMLIVCWFMDGDIMDMIKTGGIAYELCRPLDLYNMWFAKSCGTRLARAALRCFPVLLVAFFLPEPFGLSLPANFGAFCWFVATMILGFFVVVSFCLLTYLTAFFTIEPTGVQIVISSFVEFFSGALIPFPFLPEPVQRVFALLPFGAMQNTPLRAYSGDLSGEALYLSAGLQVFWLVVLVVSGKLLMKKAMRRVVSQGG